MTIENKLFQIVTASIVELIVVPGLCVQVCGIFSPLAILNCKNDHQHQWQQGAGENGETGAVWHPLAGGNSAYERYGWWY